jgi:hypothetical protein
VITANFYRIHMFQDVGDVFTRFFSGVLKPHEVRVPRFKVEEIAHTKYSIPTSNKEKIAEIIIFAYNLLSFSTTPNFKQ